MPPTAIYHVNFSHGNLTPTLDVNGWGPMVQSPPAPGVVSWADAHGLTLQYTRQTGAARGENRVHVPIPQMTLPSAVRLIARVGFDKPRASTRSFPEGTKAEPWAVVLRVRFGASGPPASTVDGVAYVTCQFHPTGVRLNTPGALQTDPAGVLDEPLDYSKYWRLFNPPRFNLEHAFCGYHAAVTPQQPPHVAGSGSLALLGKNDHRVYSAKSFSAVAAGAFIKELSVVLTMTEMSFGRITVRLRSFTLFLQSVAEGPGFAVGK